MKLEIMYTCRSVPFMAIPTLVLFILEVRGYSKLYDNISDTKFGKKTKTISIFIFMYQVNM